jgi:alkanesulfonate monooxygenase SsuD/methylene tetrahydromethanopterin reductase-like flavin-dependent oxidoreductase (luciferase family)
MSTALEFWVYLPQMRMTMEQMTERAQAAEAAGFAGVAGMDHLAPPGAEGTPMFEPMVTNAWLAARTHELRVGSLVLCDSFRHPAVLAREAVTIDHASGGRFELGLGWGSVPDELEAFGIGSREAADRIGRMRESLEIVQALWHGETVDYEGEHFRLHGARQQPGPLGTIPIVIGGAGRRTMELVAAHADWWNVHIGIVDKLDDMRGLAGTARCSLQLQVAVVPSEERRAEVTQVAQRRFGPTPVIGTVPELVDHFGALVERGVERVYLWFCDFGPPETLLAFGEDVLGHFSPPD